MQTAFLLTLALIPGADSYPNSSVIIEADALLKIDAKTTIILDAREKDVYKDGHIPGAIHFASAEWSKAIPGKPEEHAKRLGAMGVRANTPVVIYAGPDVRDSARSWWMLKYAGMENVRLLNGGIAAWESAGGKLEKGIVEPRAVDFGKPAIVTGRLAQKDDVLAMVKGKAQIVDARSTEEFCGETNTAKRNGHIPGAKPLEWTQFVGKDKKFKSVAELKKILHEADIDLDAPTATYCQGGGRAAVVAFGLELMGAKNVRNYYKSWGEWGNLEDVPVEKSSPKKK